MTGSLSPDERQHLTFLFDRAAHLPAAERASFVERECGANAALRDELSRLLGTLDGDDVVERLKIGSVISSGARTGTDVGPYRLLERIGMGGMGEVYAASQTEPVRRHVALKVIKPGMDSAQVVMRFEAERQALARMTHPHVAQILDGGVTSDGLPYFVMEHVAGDPITDYCDRHKLSTHERLELFLSVCAGVQHAHQKGLIHRDLKPSNLLVTVQDGQAIPKIIDFGIARATTGSLSERTLHTMVGQVMGTLEYMSPEQADPTALDIDTRSDVYSLGVVLYELVSGLLPFEHASADRPLSEIQRAIRELDPPTPSTRLKSQTDATRAIALLHGTDPRALARQLTGDLDWICLKALEKDPARRYASASALADDVRRHLAHEPVLAGKPGVLYRARKYVRRHRIGVTAGALVFAALVVGAFGLFEAEAQGRAALPLADGFLVEQLLERADELMPPYPELLPELEAFRMRGAELVGRLPKHVATLEELRRLEGRESEDGVWEFDALEDEWRARLLSLVIQRIGRLESELLNWNRGDESAAAFGWAVPKREEFARMLEAGFAEGGAYAAAWQQALPEIRRAYPELPNLAPQMGLVPLGPDKTSGLWEFAHLMSGEPAARDDASGDFVMTDSMGLVFVLLPGGTFTMGASPEDTLAETVEYPARTVAVPPFFLSKYEMTREQWSRIASMPSKLPGRPQALLPIVGISWEEADRAMQLLGLELPSEEQWEYAARAGTDTPWWTGSDPASLEGMENLYDQTRLEVWPEYQALSVESPLPWSDGHGRHSPVGIHEDVLESGARVQHGFPGNPFGLHDMLGNATEWTSTNHPPGTDDYRTRGGQAGTSERLSRASFRSRGGNKEFKNPELGVRPARAVDG